MKVDILQAISELLYQRNKLVVPGIGTFESETTPARADFVQGVLYPPVKTFSFSELSGPREDNTLTNFVASRYNLSAYQAEESVQRFVAQTSTALQQRDAIFIPEVGQLYLDTTQKMWFVPEKNRNYNTQVFGLPFLEFDRIIREVVAPNSGQLIPLETSQLPVAAALPLNFGGGKNILQNITPIQILVTSATVLLLLMMALTCNSTHNSGYSDTQTEGKVQLTAANTNISPTTEKVADVTESIGEPISTNGELPPPAVAEPAPETVAPAPKVVVPEKQKVQPKQATEATRILKKEIAYRCTMIVGCYSDKKNVTAKLAMIKAQGMKAFEDKIRGLTRIGVTFNYTSPDSKLRMMQRIKTKINPEAWELK